MIDGYIALEQIDQQHNEMHRKIFMFGFTLLPNTLTTVPTLTQLPVNACVKYVTGSTRRIYFNFSGVLTYITLTNA